MYPSRSTVSSVNRFLISSKLLIESSTPSLKEYGRKTARRYIPSISRFPHTPFSSSLYLQAAEEREKLENILTRISKVKGKIDAMSHSNQSMTVKSPSRYPSKSAGEEDYQALFSYKDGSASAGFPVGKLLLNGGLHREFGIDGTLELFQFFSETACESLPKEVHSKASDGFTHSRGNAYSEYLIEPPKFPNSSCLAEDRTALDSSFKPKHQSLPPPPPSLLLHNSRSLPGPESFSFKPAVKQLQSLKLPVILPDLPMVSNTAFGAINSLSKTSEHRSPETSSSTLVAGKVVIHPSSGLHGGCEQEEKMDSTVRSGEAIPCLRILPTPPPLPPSLAATSSPTQKLHSSGNSGSTSTQVDNSQLIPSLPIVDSKRAALLASIRDPGIVLRKAGVLHHSTSPTTPSSPLEKDKNSSGYENIPGAPKLKGNLLAEVASSLKMRRLAMQGSMYSKEQAEHIANASPAALRRLISMNLTSLVKKMTGMTRNCYRDGWLSFPHEPGPLTLHAKIITPFSVSGRLIGMQDFSLMTGSFCYL
ncbi:uncharacterized protein LOC131251594 isoform X3 [Magnolia sinica]|uniref:uncharacterized protein LOC131251594 isoform X3 n=1 Tax=Magnolia sinica TaxID=86752 RepID=UPI0026593FAD|nr:uncharacterized protein LOC131251594 isoform X3 [Magnolia sinica]